MASLDAATQQTPDELLHRVEVMPTTRFLVKARIIVGVATFFDAFDVLAIAYVLPVLVGLWKLSPQEVGFLISAGFIGQLIGALFFGWLAERWGRLRVTQITVAIFGVMSLACAFAPSYWWLFAFRTLQGIGLGGEVPVAAAYINELAKAKGRGRFFLLYELVFPLGLVAAALIGVWAVPNLGWQSMFVIGALPAFLALVMRRILPESPRWLLSRGRTEEARRAVEILEQQGRLSSKVTEGSERAPTVAEQKPTDWREIFGRRYLPRTLMIWNLWICSYFVTYGLTAWLPTVYRTIFKLPIPVALQYGLITSVAGFLGAALCAFVIDKIGRRYWFAGAFVAGGSFLAILYLKGAASASEVLIYASLSYFFISGCSVALYLYTPELYPTRIRAIATGTASAWLRVASAAGPSIVGMIIATSGLAPVFAVFAIIAILGGLVSLMFGVETTDRQLEEVSP